MSQSGANKDRGVITTKFFEYLGAGKPILLIGYTDSVAANIIKKHNAGFVENDPVAIANILKTCILNKKNGKISKISSEAANGFSRQEQTMQLIEFLKKVQS